LKFDEALAVEVAEGFEGFFLLAWKAARVSLSWLESLSDRLPLFERRSARIRSVSRRLLVTS
jgi:hypothetical protein